MAKSGRQAVHPEAPALTVAMLARLRSPPLTPRSTADPILVPAQSSSRNILNVSRTRFALSWAVNSRAGRRNCEAYMTVSHTVPRGNIASSCSTYPTVRFHDVGSRGAPSYSTSPVRVPSLPSRALRTLRRVVFPAPDDPRIPRYSPCLTAPDTPRSSRLWPGLTRGSPLGTTELALPGADFSTSGLLDSAALRSLREPDGMSYMMLDHLRPGGLAAGGSLRHAMLVGGTCHRGSWVSSSPFVSVIYVRELDITAMVAASTPSIALNISVIVVRREASIADLTAL